MSKERRRFFRINDRISLQASKVSTGELNKKLDDFTLNRHQFSRRIDNNLLAQEQLSDLHAIEEKMPELARYLGTLQKQIDRLTATVLPENTGGGSQEKNVSLSAQGISFVTDDSFEPVDVVELILQLSPVGQQIMILSRVVLVEDNEDSSEIGRYRVSLDFEHIHDFDRETLIKHVHSKQLRELGAARNDAI